jgi:antitoxin VapB
MSATAKVFRSGNSQAVRLPKELRFEDGVVELAVERRGEALILRPKRRGRFSDEFLKTLGAWPDFERPPQGRERRRRLFP